MNFLSGGRRQSDYKGTMYWDRTSFVIDPKGTLRKTYLKVNPEGHERVLLDDIKAMQEKARSAAQPEKRGERAAFADGVQGEIGIIAPVT